MQPQPDKHRIGLRQHPYALRLRQKLSDDLELLGEAEARYKIGDPGHVSPRTGEALHQTRSDRIKDGCEDDGDLRCGVLDRLDRARA